MKGHHKTRAWVVDRKEYYKSTNEAYDHLAVFYNNIPFLSAVVIESCTGLKDKNGKLIYEGDIVQITGENLEKFMETISQVTYDKNSGFYPFHEELFDTSGLGLVTEKIGIEWAVEIIGNINENPELLEQK